MTDLAVQREPQLMGRWLQVFDTIFLWIPEERSPSVRSIVVYMLRQIVLGPLIALIIIILAAVIRGIVGSPISTSHTHGYPPKWEIICMWLFLAGQACFIEELSRFSFIRRASNPSKSIILFTAVTILWPLTSWSALHWIAPIQLTLEIAASGFLYTAVCLRKWNASAAVALIMLLHTVILGLSFAFLL